MQLMEIGDVHRKDIIDHPENYTLLTTLDEGLFHAVFSEILIHSNGTVVSFGDTMRFIWTWSFFSETWRRFKEEGENLTKASQTSVCEDGIREMVTFLNPRQIEGLCSP